MSFYMEMILMSVPAGRPIGYWLKHLNDLIERQFELTLAGESLTRRHWQVLNTLARGDNPEQSLAPFWEENNIGLATVLSDLAERGWVVTRMPGGPELTQAGRQGHSQTAERVRQARSVIMAGLTPQQYTQTVENLAAMAGNVEAALGVHR
jgi:DNA-binding MarR family transcriptional regulator